MDADPLVSIRVRRSVCEGMLGAYSQIPVERAGAGAPVAREVIDALTQALLVRATQGDGETPMWAGAMPLRERTSLADEWRQFERMVLDPIKAEAIQRRECRRAFYTGASAFFELMNSGLDAGREPTELDLQYVSSLDEELREFGRKLARGEV